MHVYIYIYIYTHIHTYIALDPTRALLREPLVNNAAGPPARPQKQPFAESFASDSRESTEVSIEGG